jgi:hypothetical protein
MATATIKKVTQAEAMRKALTALGGEVKNNDLGEYVKTNFGIELDMKYISQLKSAAKTSLGLKGKKGRKKKTKLAAGTSTNGTAPADSPPATPPGVSPKLRHNLHDILTDMEAIHEIADRIGGEGVRRILSLLGK